MSTNSSRESILGRLWQGQRSLPDATQPANYRPMVPLEERSAVGLQARFVNEVRTAGCQLYQVSSAGTAIEAILTLIGEDKTILAWELEHIGLPGLGEAISSAGIHCRAYDPAVRIGLTGADAGLAATGSLVLQSGPGRSRAASLLPPVHIAVLKAKQILPDMESWWAEQRASGLEHIRQRSNVVVITGPSRTADIAMQLVMGMHGPRELHLILLDE